MVSHVRGRVSDRLVQRQSDGKSTDLLRVFASDSHFNNRNCNDHGGSSEGGGSEYK